MQCLAKKEEGWQPENDDQDFELESDYFLTGQGDGSPDDEPLMIIEPVRHGVEYTYISNLVSIMNEVSIEWLLNDR